MANNPIQYQTYTITEAMSDSVIGVEVAQAARVEDVASYLERKECNANAPPSSVRFLESQNNEPFRFKASHGSTVPNSCTIEFDKRRKGGNFIMFVTINGYRFRSVEYCIEPVTIKTIDPQ